MVSVVVVLYRCILSCVPPTDAVSEKNQSRDDPLSARASSASMRSSTRLFRGRLSQLSHHCCNCCSCHHCRHCCNCCQHRPCCHTAATAGPVVTAVTAAPVANATNDVTATSATSAAVVVQGHVPTFCLCFFRAVWIHFPLRISLTACCPLPVHVLSAGGTTLTGGESDGRLSDAPTRKRASGASSLFPYANGKP